MRYLFRLDHGFRDNRNRRRKRSAVLGRRGAYPSEEETSQTTSQENTNPSSSSSSSQDDSFNALIQETVTLDAWEVYCNTALYNDPLLDDIGLIVYLNNISLSQDGDMTFTLYITSDHGVSYGVRTEVTVGEKAPQEVMKSSGTIKPGIWDYANETYTVSNPNMEDVILRVQVITDDNQSREIILPIHFLGDYLTDAPASEIHLPVLNAENTDFEIYDDASFTIDQFSTRLVRAWQEDDGNGIRLIFAVEQPFATPAFIFSGVYSTFEHLPAKRSRMESATRSTAIIIYPTLL